MCDFTIVSSMPPIRRCNDVVFSCETSAIRPIIQSVICLFFMNINVFSKIALAFRFKNKFINENIKKNIQI